MGAAFEACLQSFRVLLTPLPYIHVGHIDMETCNSCGGHVKIIACIEDPVVIEKILTHLDSTVAGDAARGLPPSRAPPGSMKTQSSCEKAPPPGSLFG